MEFQTVKGMRDLLPDTYRMFKQVIKIVRELFDAYNYQEVSMPVLEPFELLAAKSGEEIKETMYVFEDKAGRKLALRPEMTASIARLYITHFMKAAKKPLRLGYIGACYRYDNPQYGRYREFRQAGFELIGSSQAEADAEILSICDDLMTRIGFNDFDFKVGHVGILREILEQEGIGETIQNKIFSLIDRDKIDEAYQIFKKHDLSNEVIELIKSLMQLKGKNVKDLINQARGLLGSYPKARECVENLKAILTMYLSSGKRERLLCDLGFARGLEYYTGMIFEIYIPDLAIAVGGGGRYDKLIENFHGQSTSAVGCAPGIDRIVLAMEKKEIFEIDEDAYENKIIITCLDEDILPQVLLIAHDLRKKNFAIEFDVTRKSLKKLLSFAAEKKIRYALIIGPEEIVKQEVAVKDLKTEKQTLVAIDDLITYFKEKMKN
ncbi:MAG: histidine--tRNA ligase [Candidatus Helarchaeota archaeon]|nr:histidine--tRNA ligase [Candidatus Helarchaeota archaeon]